MLLNVLVKAGVSQAACAGFDGYSVGGDNYLTPTWTTESEKKNP